MASKKINTKINRIVIVLANVAGIGFLLTALSITFVNRHHLIVSTNEDNIAGINRSTGQQLDNMLKGYSRENDVISTYINDFYIEEDKNPLTIEEFSDYINIFYSPKQFNIQLLSYQSTPTIIDGVEYHISGIRVNTKNLSYNDLYKYNRSEENNKVYYSEKLDPSIYNCVIECSIPYYSNDIDKKYTYEFIDNYTNEKSFGICSTVMLEPTVDNPTGKYTLMMVYNSHNVFEEYIYTEKYLDAFSYYGLKMTVISKKGTYVIKSMDFDGNDIVEYLSNKYPSFSEKDRKNLYKKLYNRADINSFYIKDKNGKKVLFTFTKIEAFDYYLISETPYDSFKKTSYLYGWETAILATLLALIFVDIIYVVNVNKNLKLRTEEAYKASQAKSEFLSSMSHDIRTPMNAIVGFTSLAKKNDANKEYVDDCLNKIELSSNHLLALINDVLDISKVESGKFALNIAPFELSNSVSKLVNCIQPIVTKKHIDFTILSKNLSHNNLISDELRINQIAINILSNAAKYTEEGGRITFLIEERIVSSNKLELLLQVKDNGIGMSEEFLEHIYESFTREKDTRINKVQGTGLGMSITKKLVELLDGSIDIQSKLNEGTTVTTKFIIEFEKKAEYKVSGNMLLIDDPFNIGQNRHQLESAGLAVDSGIYEPSLAFVGHKEYDYIIFDYNITKNPKELIEKIKAKSKAKIIIMSSLDFRQFNNPLDENLYDCFIQRPLFVKNITTAIDKIQNKKSETTEEGEEFKNIHLLVAEDNELNFEILSEMMSIKGFQIDHAWNGKECFEMLEKAEDNTYHIVLMDIQMPIMNGYEATQLIRRMKDKNKSQIPIIAMTADAFAEDIEKAKKAGMNAHISKPIDFSKLEDIIKINLQK